MSLITFLESIFSLPSAIPEFLKKIQNPSPPVPEEESRFEVEVQPLCASAGNLDAYSSQPAALKDLLQNEPSTRRGIDIFQKEAIALSDLSVSRPSMPFGEVDVGSSKSESFFINNSSSCPIKFAINSVPTGYSVSSTGDTIPAGSSRSITVTFRPTIEGQDYNGYINVTPGASSVNVTGKGKVKPKK